MLGPLEVHTQRKRLELGGPKPRVLLASLVANRNNVVTTDALIEAIWTGAPPVTARKSLQKFVWSLRQDLGEMIVTRDPGYLLTLDENRVDAGRLEMAVSKARKGSPSIEQLEAALSEWRGPPYPELAETEWGHAESARLLELMLEGEELLIEVMLTSNAHNRAISRLEELITRHPYRESLWSLLMRALYASGRQADALEAYRRLAKVLGEELGLEPSHELSRLEERILMQDPDLAPSTEPKPTNLAAPITTFVGRSAEITELSETLATKRLVTLLGPAGSGKTRLATELGRAVLDRFPTDGVWFVDLAPVGSPDRVANAIANVLAVGQFTDRPTLEVIVDYLRGKTLMLILDNCEHVVGRVVEVVGNLLGAVPGLSIVATSRERLGFDGEAIFDVLPLPYPQQDEEVTEAHDAIQLFVDRARRVDRSVNLQGNEAVIGEIVRRLDGIPLALELAAARVRSMGLTGLRAGLDDRFVVLTSITRVGPARHETLEAALDWSYEMLSASEQMVFDRLSVFRGGFDQRSAAAVCGFGPLEPGQTEEILVELYDKSLISPAAGTELPRYTLLESLREYGERRIDSAAGKQLRDSHLNYFCTLAEEAAPHMNREGQREWQQVLHLEYDNMRKALRWAFNTAPELGVRIAVALSAYWDSVGPRNEANAWLSRAVEVAEDLSPELLVDALLEAASISSSSQASIPIDFARRAVEVSAEIADEFRHARALIALCWALALDEQPAAALEAGEAALGILDELGDDWERAHAMERIGQATYQRPEEAIATLESAREIYVHVGDRRREALTLYKIADRLAHSLGELERAIEYAQKAVQICDEMGNTHDGGHARLEYGKILRRAGDPQGAISHLHDALAQTTRSGDERCSVRALTALGNTQLEIGDPETALEHLVEALQRGRKMGEVHTTRSAIAGIARIRADAGKPEDAVVLLGFVEKVSQELDVPVSDRAIEKREAERSRLRERVGDEFDALWARGSAMTADEAVAMALQ